jgi:hypothetical protein
VILKHSLHRLANALADECGEELRGAAYDCELDLAYTAALERFDTFLRTELGINFKTPLVMLNDAGPLILPRSWQSGMKNV